MFVSLRFSYRICPRASINIRKFYSHAFPKRNLIRFGNALEKISGNNQCTWDIISEKLI
jgi:hypothetical protein